MNKSMPVRTPAARDKPFNAFFVAVLRENRSLSLWQRFICSGYLIALSVLAFCFYTSCKRLSVSELEALVESKNSDASYNSFRESLNNLQYFFAAACRVNPLYIIAPFVCLTGFSLVNMTADWFLKCAAKVRGCLELLLFEFCSGRE